MPYRRVPIVVGQTYHVFNRSIAQQPIFLGTRYYRRGVELLEYYSYLKPGLRFSHYNRLPLQQRNDFLENLKKNGRKQIQLFSFCLMPNHVHFLIKEIVNGGISQFMSNFQNGYAKYLNLRTERSGSVFLSMFKAVRIETDEQLLHVNRYIHLNPLTSYVIKKVEELETYPWCSFREYLKGKSSDIVDTEFVLNFFSSKRKFKKFTFDQVDYQRQLDKVKHLILE